MPTAPTSRLSPAELEAFVDGIVGEAAAEDHIPGVVVSVVQDGRIILEKGYGAAAAGARADPRATLFRLGSISKVFTWIEVLKLQSTGRLRMVTPINDLLPAALRTPAEGFASPIRFEQLMAHTAGLESRELGRSFAESPEQLHSLSQTLIRVRPRRVREPGELSSFSDYGAALAGAALEETLHLPFNDLVERDILGPAGLGSTSFREPYPARADLPTPLAPQLAGRLAQGYDWSDRGLKPAPFAWAEGLAPALSASSTAHDMARLMQALLAGGRTSEGRVLWSADVDAALHAPVHRAAPGFPGWTHGLLEEPMAGDLTALGSAGAVPGFRAHFLVVPALGLGVFVAANSERAERLTQRLPRAVVAAVHPAAGAVSPPQSRLNARRLDGLYLTTRRAYHGLEGFVDRLTGLSKVSVGGDGGLVIAHGPYASAWAPQGLDRFSGPGGAERLVFMEASPGRPSTFVASDDMAAQERVGFFHKPIALALLAAGAAVAALLSLYGPLVRRGRDDARQTPAQAFSSRCQIAASLLHLTSLAAFAAFLRHANDAVRLTMNWPDGWIVAASWGAFGAAFLTCVQIFQLPQVWRGTRRLPGWSAGRRMRHTVSVLVFLSYGVVAAAWGALEPWST